LKHWITYGSRWHNEVMFHIMWTEFTGTIAVLLQMCTLMRQLPVVRFCLYLCLWYRPHTVLYFAYSFPVVPGTASHPTSPPVVRAPQSKSVVRAPSRRQSLGPPSRSQSLAFDWSRKRSLHATAAMLLTASALIDLARYKENDWFNMIKQTTVKVTKWIHPAKSG